MDLMTQHKQQREPYWSEIERFFGTLSPQLLQQALLIKNTMSAFFSETGSFKEILCRPYDYPILAFHFWLLDDLQIPHSKKRVDIEKHLLSGMFFSFVATYLREGMLDNNSPFDNRHIFLEQSLTQQATFHFAQLFPETSPFWEYYHTFWCDYAEAMLWEQQPPHKKVAGFEHQQFVKLAPTKIPVVAVLLKTGHENLLPDILTIMDYLNAIFQLRQDVSAIRRDLFQGNFSYPIIKTMKIAGIPLDRPIIPEQVLGAAILTGSIKKLYQESLEQLTECRTIAQQINLPTWLHYFDTVEEITREMMGLFSFGTKDNSHRQQQAPFLPYTDTMSTSIKMAEDYLLADLTFRESWEIQRYGPTKEPIVIARAIPMGFIVELLCENGHDMATQVDEIFEILEQNNFCYYEDSDVIAPDADDVGLLLRLYKFSSNKEKHHDILQRPLKWLKQNIQPSGEILLFWEDVDVHISDRLAIPGKNCIAIEINILLGLIDYDWTKYHAIIEKSALNLFERFIQNDLTGISYYDSFYTLWGVFKLLSQFEILPINNDLQIKLEQATDILLKRLVRETKRSYLSPQNIAFLILTCLAYSKTTYLFNPDWITILLKHQRYDGSWDDEPFFPTPHRGVIGYWYSSRLMTTAFCYHALQRYKQTS